MLVNTSKSTNVHLVDIAAIYDCQYNEVNKAVQQAIGEQDWDNVFILIDDWKTEFLPLAFKGIQETFGEESLWFNKIIYAERLSDLFALKAQMRCPRNFIFSSDEKRMPVGQTWTVDESLPRIWNDIAQNTAKREWNHKAELPPIVYVDYSTWTNENYTQEVEQCLQCYTKLQKLGVIELVLVGDGQIQSIIAGQALSGANNIHFDGQVYCNNKLLLGDDRGCLFLTNNKDYFNEAVTQKAIWVPVSTEEVLKTDPSSLELL